MKYGIFAMDSLVLTLACGKFRLPPFSYFGMIYIFR